MAFIPQWLHNWLGLNYPEKRIPFAFSLPLIKSTTLPVLNTLYQLQKKRATDADDAEFLSLLLKNLKQLNRSKASVARREEYNHRLTGLFYPLAVVLVTRFSKDGGVPDSDKRAQLLECMIAICTELINSHGLLIQYFQQCSRFRYARSLPNLDLAIFRLFEFLKLKQTIKGLRYQELTAKSWNMANTLIHILAASERMNIVLKPLEQQYRSDTPTATTRSIDVYLSLQIVERLQLSYWPVQWQTWLQRSIGLGELKIALHQSANLPKNAHTSLVYCADTLPMRFTPIKGANEIEPLCLQWDQLQVALTSDLAQVLRSRQYETSAPLSKHLSLFSPDERLAIAQLQYQCYRDYPSRQSIFIDQKKEVPDLRIFIGFNDVFSLLHHIGTGGGWKGVGQRMSDLLARHSAVFSDDAETSAGSAWFLRHQDDKLICLSTLESRHTSVMKIGDLAAYMLEQTDWHQPQLGVIQRILRPQTGQVYIELRVLSQYAEAIVIDVQPGVQLSNSTEDQNQKIEMIRAIKGTYQNSTQLLVPRGVKFEVDRALKIKTKNGPETIQPGHLISASKGFSMVALRPIESTDFQPQDIIQAAV